MASIQKINTVSAYLNNLKSGVSNLYLSIGKLSEWNAYDTPPENTTISYNQELQAKLDAVAIFKVNSDNCTRGFKTVHWVSGMNIENYDSTKQPNEYTHPYYVLVDNSEVYLCVDMPLNRNQLSSQKPNGSQGVFETSDGFSWVRLYVVPPNLRNRITSYTPIVPEGIVYDLTLQSYGILSFKTREIGGNDLYQNPTIELHDIGNIANGAIFSVRTAVNGTKSLLTGINVINSGTNYKPSSYGVLRDSINTGNGASLIPIIENGVITNVQIVNSGALYDSAICMVVGDGTGAQIDLTIASGVITGVHVISGGSGYTSYETKLIVVAGNSTRYLTPSLIPYNGFSAAIYDILRVNILLVYVRIPTLNPDYLPSDTGKMYRQIGLLENVKSGNNLATLDAYAVSGNPYYNILPYNRLSIDAFPYVYLNNRTAFIHSSSQQEEIIIPLKF